MVIGFGSIKSGPILEHTLIEHNIERQLRPVYVNIRKVKGKRGWLLRRFGHYIAPDPTPEGLGHHAIEVGEYAYELHTDEANQKYLLVQRLTGDQIWIPTVQRVIIGYCNFTDDEIAIHAMKAQSWMRGREGGRYHVKRNNCQHFVQELWKRLSTSIAGKDIQSLGDLNCTAQDNGRSSKEPKECLVAFSIRDEEYSDDKMSISTLWSG